MPYQGAGGVGDADWASQVARCSPEVRSCKTLVADTSVQLTSPRLRRQGGAKLLQAEAPRGLVLASVPYINNITPLPRPTDQAQAGWGGCYASEEDAARVYDCTTVQARVSGAKRNFPCEAISELPVTVCG
jgi:hypothetical protein